MKMCSTSFNEFIKSKKFPQIKGQYHSISGKSPIYTEPYLGDIIIGVNSYSEKWLYKICDDKVYFAPAFRYERYSEKYANSDPVRLTDLIKKNYNEIIKFIKNHFLEYSVVCSFSDDLYATINSKYMGNFIKKLSIEYNGQSQEWFYQITHWDGWFSTLIEPFTDLNKDNFIKNPIKVNVARHKFEITDRIMKSYEFDLKSIRHATKGDNLLKKNRNKIFNFKIGGLNVTVNPNRGHFDYEYLIHS